MKDTPDDVNRLIHQRIMALGPERRFLMGMSMLATSRALILSSIPNQTPEAERKRFLFERLYEEACPIPL